MSDQDRLKIVTGLSLACEAFKDLLEHAESPQESDYIWGLVETWQTEVTRLLASETQAQWDAQVEKLTELAVWIDMLDNPAFRFSSEKH